MMVMMACYPDSALRACIIRHNIRVWLSDHRIKEVLVIVNHDSRYLPYLFPFPHCARILFMVETAFYDFGKWAAAVRHVHPNSDILFFTNDSVIATAVPSRYIQYVEESAHLDFVGLYESHEIVRHCPSFLFAVRNASIPVFSRFVERVIGNCTVDAEKGKPSLNDIIRSLEIPLSQQFNRPGCFITIPPQKTGYKNILFWNDAVYFPLLWNQKIPFIKFKRLLMDSSRMFYENPHLLNLDHYRFFNPHLSDLDDEELRKYFTRHAGRGRHICTKDADLSFVDRFLVMVMHGAKRKMYEE